MNNYYCSLSRLLFRCSNTATMMPPLKQASRHQHQHTIVLLIPATTTMMMSLHTTSRTIIGSSSTLSADASCLPTSTSTLTSTTSTVMQQHQQNHQQRRHMNHGARSGNHMQKLDEMAHEKSHKEAQERRKKKKDKAAARKSKKKGGGGGGGAAATKEAGKDDEDFEDALPDPDQIKASMDQIVTTFHESLKAIRGAEPTAELFDDVMVDAYDSSTPLPQVAQVVIQSPTLATATCYDPGLSNAVRVAIQNRLQLNPSTSDDGEGGGGDGVVKIPIPRVSMETRQQTANELGKRAEHARQRIRKERQHALKTVKQGVAGRLDGVSKDDAFHLQEDIESVTEKAIQQINDVADKKHDSIMAV